MMRVLWIVVATAGVAALGLGVFGLAVGIGQADLFRASDPAPLPQAEPARDPSSPVLSPRSPGERLPDPPAGALDVSDPGPDPPAGSPRVAAPGSMPTSVQLPAGRSVPFILKDGQRRTVTLKGTERVFAHNDVTVWATATVEVSGPGVAPETAEIPAGYFQAPIILNGVRVYVATTRDMDPGALDASDGVPQDARLLISDANYTMTSVSDFHWPFPELLWEEGFETRYSRSLLGDPDNLRRSHRGVALGVPKRTIVGAWARGQLSHDGGGTSWSAYISPPSGARHQHPWLGMHDLEAVARESSGTTVAPGQPVALGQGGDGRTYVHVGGDYELGLMLAEWYTAHASPLVRSYIKDWLVAGPFYAPPDGHPLHPNYLGNEEQVNPLPGDTAGAQNQWRLWDNVVPGVVSIGDSIDPFPFSGWARVHGNYAGGAAYLATYVHSESTRAVVLNIGTSDMLQVWVDDRLVFGLDTCFGSDPESRGRTIIVDQHQVPVSLQAGWNRLLVKSAQGDGCPQSWQLSLRISDEAGQPIPELTINPHRDQDAPVRFLAPPVGETPGGDLPESLVAVLHSPPPQPEPMPVEFPLDPDVAGDPAPPGPQPASSIPDPVSPTQVIIAGLAVGYMSIGRNEEFRYFVADPPSHRIQMFRHNQYLSQWGVQGQHGGQLSWPGGVAIDPERAWIYVADTGNHRVQKFSATGRYLGHWGTFGIGNSQFNGPTDVVYDPETRRIYVVDSGNSRVQVFKDMSEADMVVEYQFQFGSRGTGNGQFMNPTGIAVEPGGHWAYVTDTGNQRVQKFNYSGVYFAQWGGEGTARGKFKDPTGIAVDASSMWVYVADTGNHRVQKFNTAGVVFDEWGGQGSGEGQFIAPSGIATLTGSGWVFVADAGNQRVQMFNGTGAFFGQWGTGDHAGQQGPRPMTAPPELEPGPGDAPAPEEPPGPGPAPGPPP